MVESFIDEEKEIYPQLSKTENAEFAVLGSNLCAAVTASLLCRTKKSVVLICEKTVGKSELNALPCAALSPNYFEKSRAALSFIKAEGVRVRECDLLMFSDRKKHMRKIHEFARITDGTLFLPSEKMFRFCASGVIAEKGSLSFSPYHTAKKLAAAVTLGGGTVFENTPIKSIENHDGIFCISSESGCVFAGKIADCRGLYFDDEAAPKSYVCSCFEAPLQKYNLCDFYKNPLSFCGFEGNVYSCVGVPFFSTAVFPYVRKKAVVMKNTYEKMFSCGAKNPHAAFDVIKKVPKNGFPLIKQIDRGFYAQLCPYENGAVAQVVAAREFIKMFHILT